MKTIMTILIGVLLFYGCETLEDDLILYESFDTFTLSSEDHTIKYIWKSNNLSLILNNTIFYQCTNNDCIAAEVKLNIKNCALLWIVKKETRNNDFDELCIKKEESK